MVKNFLTILVCPLDWGIGHATRCVPVIKALLDNHHKVILAADGRSFDFLQEYFPDLELVRFPGVKVSYPRGKNMTLAMAMQAPALLFGICKEHRRLKKIIREFHIDVVISDNRFGLWTDRAYSVYMTHQIMIKAPRSMEWLEPLLHRFHGWFIKKYDECWVPDLPGETNLSGDLGHKYPLPSNGHFLGILSRFSGDGADDKPDLPGPDVLVLLSGPEPQRGILENIILTLAEQAGLKNIVILQGIPGSQAGSSSSGAVRMFSHMPDAGLMQMIKAAKVIICRPGYSTLMDLAALERTAVLVPTPGQTEQEYLADYLSSGGLFLKMDQQHFDLETAIESGKKLKSFVISGTGAEFLEKRISGLSLRSGNED